MHVDRHIEGFGTRQHGLEIGMIEELLPDVSVGQCAQEAVFPNRAFQFVRSGLRALQGQGGEGLEAARISGHRPLDQQPVETVGKVDALLPWDILHRRRVRGEDLNVESPLVHVTDAALAQIRKTNLLEERDVIRVDGVQFQQLGGREGLFRTDEFQVLVTLRDGPARRVPGLAAPPHATRAVADNPAPMPSAAPRERKLRRPIDRFVGHSLIDSMSVCAPMSAPIQFGVTVPTDFAPGVVAGVEIVAPLAFLDPFRSPPNNHIGRKVRRKGRPRRISPPQRHISSSHGQPWPSALTRCGPALQRCPAAWGLSEAVTPNALDRGIAPHSPEASRDRFASEDRQREKSGLCAS